MTYYVAGLPYSANDICHYGILGQKWGIRRFQNKDSTRTPAGLIRYRDGGKVKSGNSGSTGGNHEKLKKAVKIAAATAGAAALGYGAYRLAKSGALDGVASKIGEAANNARTSFETKKAVNKTNRSIDQARERFERNQARETRRAARETNFRRMRDAVDISSMSDDRLQEELGRLRNESEYRRLVAESLEYSPHGTKKILMDAGKKVAGTVLAGVGSYAVRVALTKKFDPKEAADYVAPKPKKK